MRRRKSASLCSPVAKLLCPLGPAACPQTCTLPTRRRHGSRATICALENALAGLRGEAGTVVAPDDKMQLTLTA